MATRSPFWLGAALLVGTTSLCAPARAQEAAPKQGEKSISVLSVQTADAFDQADALTKALRNAVRASGAHKLDEGQHSLEVIALSLDCAVPPDALCQVRIADEIGTDRYVWGQLNLKGEGLVTGTVNVWRRGEGTQSVPIEYSSNLTEAADSALSDIARAAFEELTGGPAPAQLTIEAGDVDGEVFVDGQKVGNLTAGRGVFEVPSGAHDVRVQAPGYVTMTAKITLEPKGSRTLELTAVPSGDDGDTTQKVLGFAGLGMGVAFAAVGVVSSLQVSSLQGDDAFERFRQQYPGSEDACGDAEAGVAPQQVVEGAMSTADALDTCDRASTFEILQAVFYPLAGLSGGVGAVLLLTADWDGEDAEAVRVQPRVTADGGSVGVTVRF